MPYDGPNRFDEVRARINTRDVAETLLGPAVSEQPGKVYWHCFGHDDTKPSLMLNTEGQWAGRFRCWSCGIHGDVVWLVSERKGLTVGQALNDLLGPAERSETRRSKPEGIWTPEDDEMVLSAYLEHQKWPRAVSDELGIHAVTDSRHYPRIRFPFRLQGETVYWQDRAISPGSEPKWLGKNGVCPMPYEADRLVKAGDEGWVFVCEGVSDAVSLISVFPDAPVIGIPGASAMKRAWLEILEHFRIVVIGDNDDAGSVFRGSFVDGKFVERFDLYVPDEYNDLSDWYRADPVFFPMDLKEMLP